MTNLRLLTERVFQNNANFVKDKSGLQLSQIIELILKLVAFKPLKAKAWKPLPKYIANNEAAVNIKNTDGRCFGYSLLYFIDPRKISHRHFDRPNLYKQEMFVRNQLAALP